MRATAAARRCTSIGGSSGSVEHNAPRLNAYSERKYAMRFAAASALSVASVPRPTVDGAAHASAALQHSSWAVSPSWTATFAPRSASALTFAPRQNASAASRASATGGAMRSDVTQTWRATFVLK